MILPKLNIPTYSPDIIDDGTSIKIYDCLREKYVALTPEEWVRQNFVNYLINNKGYPKNLLANEVNLTLNGMQRRCDTVLYDIHICPRMIIEYKRTDVNITQKIFDQICRYNMVMHVDYLIVSNGMTHYCCKIDYEKQTYEFLEDIPDYPFNTPN